MKNRVCVIDMQPIDPPIGGGRIRLLGLYSGFKNLQVTYVGSYDWPGQQKRVLKLSSNLIEIDIPLSLKHFEESDRLNTRIPNERIIDVTFPILGHYSQKFVNKAKDEATKAEIVIFSHPWLFSNVAPILEPSKQFIIYDSHNCEGVLRSKLLDNQNGFGSELARNVVKNEYEICHAADLIFACSEEDRDNFVKFYEVSPLKILIVPNGVFTANIKQFTDKEKMDAKVSLGIEGIVAVFIGSDYSPNIEAAEVIVRLASELNHITFIIMGGVGEGLKNKKIDRQSNLIITGFVEESEKVKYFAASDIALNPMQSGSGTNIKMFDFMAAGLPVVTTEIGARGILNSNNCYIVSNIDMFTENIQLLANNKELRYKIGDNGRRLTFEKFCWDNISNELSFNIKHRCQNKMNKLSPYFSIIIPTYERHHLLTKLLGRLENQIYKNFEVIIIDQSINSYEITSELSHLNLVYYLTDVRGAVKARNTGIKFASGSVIAFIDDDCEPDESWLNNAISYFKDEKVVGVEGLITSTRLDDPDYRTVTNIGFKGMGFMTANLMAKRDVLININGFDEKFDNPHFREDTDLGWRLQRFGLVPYAEDVHVYHPPHKRGIIRESKSERAKYFINDPLLLKKNPQRYKELFLAEAHYKNTELFWDYFMEGMSKHEVEMKLLNELLNDKRVDKKYCRSASVKIKK